MMSRYLAAGFLAVVAAGVAEAAALRPVAIEQCFIEPDVPSAVRWKIEGGALAGVVRYVVREYAEKQVTAGEAKAAGTGVIETALKLPQGFYEIEFPATRQRFGIVGLPASKGPPDAFFAIDGALSWLVHDDTVREGLIRVAKRSGIGMIRERLSWGGVQPSADRWDWQTPQKFDTLRRAYARHGVQVLEMAHDGPAWMGRVAVYPQDLVAAARSWQTIAGHWRPTWGGLEIWNEPDIFFGGNLPADQYVAVAKAVAYAMAGKKIDVPLVGGVTATYNREFLDTAAENGLLDCIDAFSFHTYGQAMEMEGLVQKYRDWLKAHGAAVTGRDGARIPLWITECGRPWKKGPARPSADQDAESALDIVMKGVEARACGIARYFPFVYPYYEERQNNFGMMGKGATPLRSFAGYAQMIRVLSGSEYMGDLKVVDKAIQRARVFLLSPVLPQRRLVAVIYTGRPNAKATVNVGFVATRVEGIDGRRLESASDRVPVADGLTYVWLPEKWGHFSKAYSAAVKTDTAAMNLRRFKVAPMPRNEPSPIVMRYLYDTAVVEPKAEGYRIKANPAGKMRLAVRVFNLSSDSYGLLLAGTLASRAASQPLANKEAITIGPKSSVDTSWDVNLSRLITKDGQVKAVIRTGWARTSLVLKFFGEPTLTQMLGGFQHWIRLPIRQASRWTPNVAGIGKMEMDSTPEAAWRLRVKFGTGDRWVYPYFKLLDETRLNEHTGLVIRARCRKPAVVRVFLWEGDTGVGYLTPRPIIPADGQWHVAVVQFRELAPSGANKPDPNGRLDLDQVRRISLGMNSTAAENALEVSDLFLVSDN